MNHQKQLKNQELFEHLGAVWRISVSSLKNQEQLKELGVRELSCICKHLVVIMVVTAAVIEPRNSFTH